MLEKRCPLQNENRGLNNVKEFSEKVIGIESIDEFVEFLEELIFYVGRLNYWLDQSMPWYEIVQAYDSSVR